MLNDPLIGGVAFWIRDGMRGLLLDIGVRNITATGAGNEYRMEATITLQYGPIEAEFTGDDREELQKELLGLVNFIEENQESLSGLPAPSGSSESEPKEEQTSATDWTDSDSAETTTESSGASEFQSFSAKTGVDTEFLAKLFDTPDDEDGVPCLNMYHFDEGTLEFGSYRNQRQAQATALLLYAWEECLGEKKIPYDRLKEALVDSDIETERLDNMWQAFSGDAEEWFESDGSKIHLLGQGKNHTRDLLEELEEKLDT